MTKILMVQHEENCGPARLGAWLDELGAETVLVHGPRDPIPGDLTGFDALVVLGGAMSCTSTDHPWLGPVKLRIREAVEAGVPFLGICLGHQLAAVALEGEVAPQGHLTLGLTPELLTDAAAGDPLVGDLAQPVLGVHYNHDAVTQLPAGAQVLAVAPDGQQTIVRYGARAWGVQFHLEITPDGFEEWTTAKEPERRPACAAGLEVVARAVRESDAALAAQWRPVAERFVAMASGRG